MIDELKSNIESEINLLREISANISNLDNLNAQERKLTENMISSLRNKLIIMNNAIPEIVKNISPPQSLSNVNKSANKIEKVVISDKGTNTEVILSKKDKEDFLREHHLSGKLRNKLDKQKNDKEETAAEGFKAARGYIKNSNRLFLATAQKMVAKGYFSDLKTDIKKANLDILFSSYIAMIMFSASLALIIGIILAIFLLYFNVSILFPFISAYSGSIMARLTWVIWIPIIAPLGTIAALYYYPSSERDSIEKKIDQELPFAVIHMSAIAGSGIEPSEIFKIIGLSQEYPFLRKEVRKIINQINLYGYDLVTALNYVSKNTPSKKFSELLAGLSTTISSGGNLSDFFEKRAETLLVGYRLEREKFTKIAETFMDIYISVVIAAPMILMLLLVMIQVSNIKLGFSSTEIGFIIMAIIALLNLFFIGFLQIKQPSY